MVTAVVVDVVLATVTAIETETETETAIETETATATAIDVAIEAGDMIDNMVTGLHRETDAVPAQSGLWEMMFVGVAHRCHP